MVTQYFWPEFFIINGLVKTLSSQGHTVKILTGKPNYPGGEVFDGYDQYGIEQELFADNVQVFRAPLRPRKSGGAKNLLLNYLSFVWNGLCYFPKAIEGKSYDVIFVFAPSPITSAIPAIYLKWKLKTHLAIWVQDLWPESLKATGFISNNILLKMIGWMVRGIYSSADTLLIQSKAFYKPVLQYTNADKIVYFPNAYSDKQSEIKKRVKDEGEFGKLINVLEQKFCLTFAGNLGTAQSLPTILLAAEKLKKINDFCIVFVGTGSMSTWLAKQKKERGLDNIYLAGHYPNETMPEIFKRSKALLVTLKKDEIFEYTIPSKVQAYLASGRPIIAALDGEGGRIINEAKAGIVCAAEDADGLVLSVRRLIGMSDNEQSEFGRAGREYYLANFEMKKQCQALIDILERRL